MMVTRREREYGNTTSAQHFHPEDMKKAFRDWKVWLFCLGQFGVDTMLYGEPPSPGWSLGKTGMLTSEVPRLLDFLANHHRGARKLDACAGPALDRTMLLPWCSYLHGHRRTVGSNAATRSVLRRLRRHQCRRLRHPDLGHAGWRALLRVPGFNETGMRHPLTVFRCFLVAMGLYVVVGLPLAWVRQVLSLDPTIGWVGRKTDLTARQLPNICPRYGKRTTANGMQLTVGNLSGIMAPFI